MAVVLGYKACELVGVIGEVEPLALHVLCVLLMVHSAHAITMVTDWQRPVLVGVSFPA